MSWDGQRWSVDGKPEDDIRAELLQKIQKAKESNAEKQRQTDGQTSDSVSGTQATDVANSSSAVSGNNNEAGAVSGNNATGAATNKSTDIVASGQSLDSSYVPAQAMLTCWYSLNRCVCMYLCIYGCIHSPT